MTHKRRNRCLQCGKKMGLATTYSCRYVVYCLLSAWNLYFSLLSPLYHTHTHTHTPIVSLHRCGGLFCAIHRYAETHSCSFDYKAEGRQMIARNNPVVTTPKLPKIWWSCTTVCILCFVWYCLCFIIRVGPTDMWRPSLTNHTLCRVDHR